MSCGRIVRPSTSVMPSVSRYPGDTELNRASMRASEPAILTGAYRSVSLKSGIVERLADSTPRI